MKPKEYICPCCKKGGVINQEFLKHKMTFLSVIAKERRVYECRRCNAYIHGISAFLKRYNSNISLFQNRDLNGIDIVKTKRGTTYFYKKNDYEK